MFGIWFAAILFGACVIASSLLTGSVIWFGIGMAVLLCVTPLPYLLQHRFFLHRAWNSVPDSLQPLEIELDLFARGGREAYRPNGDIAVRQLFRSTIAILLFSENRFDRFMVMLNPIRSYSAQLKAMPLDEFTDDSHEEAEPPVIVQTVKTIEVVRGATGADRSHDRHWLSGIDVSSFSFRMHGLATKWKSNEAAGWTYVHTQAHAYFSQHPHNPLHQCIADILDAKKHPEIVKLPKLPSDDTLKAALSRTPLRTYQKNQQHLEGKIDRTVFADGVQIPLAY